MDTLFLLVRSMREDLLTCHEAFGVGVSCTLTIHPTLFGPRETERQHFKTLPGRLQYSIDDAILWEYSPIFDHPLSPNWRENRKTATQRELL